MTRSSRRARGGRFAEFACALVLLLVCASFACPASAQTFGRSAVVLRDGNPTLLVDGRPFFFYGAAFFYERIPATEWRASMLAVRALGFNTLDLYVPWNWHELSDGNFDFDGHTDPRRNLRALLALARELDFKLIVRPGPVIRNEWRNGGYPDWLLTRPEYGMPLHDILEGRYPATATLQNANSDDAAAAWMRNATHMSYARRWLHTVLHEFAPVADNVIALQLDDDQGAYIDNQTWPAPHLQTYLRILEATVRDVVGPQLPVFINTYEMKVTASAPVWAMGNWYQSDAYSIGEHDRAALEFSTGLLQTQTRFPVAISEFQAGWLAQPEDPAPRPADPTNTTLALHTLLGMGVRGVIDFPAQDTVNPDGWEAPFANARYAWDAALTDRLAASARYLPTARFGGLVQRDGALLASARRSADGAIAYLTSAYDEHQITNAAIFAIVARTQDAQHACRSRNLTCDLVDLRFASDATLQHYPFVVVPRLAGMPPMIGAASERLVRYIRRGGRVMSDVPGDVPPLSGGFSDATLLTTPDGATAFLDIVNYDDMPRNIAGTRVALPGGGSWDVSPLTIPARDAVLLRYDTATKTTLPPLPPPSPGPLLDACSHQTVDLSAPGVATIEAGDDESDGMGRVMLENQTIEFMIAPSAGARAVWLGEPVDRRCGVNDAFTSVGGLRDDVEVQPPISTTDRIGKYTRSFPAGMFNRPYHVQRHDGANGVGAASITVTYDAPDVVPNGAHFERTMELRDKDHGVTISERTTFTDGPGSQDQRAVRYDSFASQGATLLDDRANGAIGFYSASTGRVASVSWPTADVEDAQIIPERTSTVVRLRFAPGGARRTRYALSRATGTDNALTMLLKEQRLVAATH